MTHIVHITVFGRIPCDTINILDCAKHTRHVLNTLRYIWFKIHYSDVIMSAGWRPKSPTSRLFRRRPKKTSKFRVNGLCEGNSPVTGGFPSQRASNAGNFSIWWRHHVYGFVGTILVLRINPLRLSLVAIGLAECYETWLCKGTVKYSTSVH